MYAELTPKSTHLDPFCRISKLAGTEMGFGATSWWIPDESHHNKRDEWGEELLWETSQKNVWTSLKKWILGLFVSKKKGFHPPNQNRVEMFNHKNRLLWESLSIRQTSTHKLNPSVYFGAFWFQHICFGPFKKTPRFNNSSKQLREREVPGTRSVFPFVEQFLAPSSSASLGLGCWSKVSAESWRTVSGPGWYLWL